jgi:hypothetical protein
LKCPIDKFPIDFRTNVDAYLLEVFFTLFLMYG